VRRGFQPGHGTDSSSSRVQWWRGSVSSVPLTPRSTIRPPRITKASSVLEGLSERRLSGSLTVERARELLGGLVAAELDRA
jgi:hypothetical protein